MNAKVYQRVELAFWDVAIAILSRSRLVRAIAHEFYVVWCEEENRDTLKMSIRAAVAGLAFGIVLFLLAYWMA